MQALLLKKYLCCRTKDQGSVVCVYVSERGTITLIAIGRQLAPCMPGIASLVTAMVTVVFMQLKHQPPGY